MIYPLHGLRGYMALLILFFHLTPLAWKEQKISLGLHHAVDVFFVLSGYVMCLVYAARLPFDRRSFRRYAIHRIARIVPLAWACVVVYFGVQLAINAAGLQMNHPLDTSVRNFVGNLLFFDANLPGFTSASVKWSVSNEMVAYFAVFPLVYFLPRRRVLLAGMIVLLLAGQALLWNSLQGLGPLFSRCVPAFLLGCILHALRLKEVRGEWLALAAIAGGAGFLWLPDRYQAGCSLLLVFATLFARGTIAAFLSNRAARFLGDISYSLYLWHSLVIVAVAGALRFFPKWGAYYFLWIWVPATVAIIIAYFSYRLIELPGKEWIKARLEPSRAA